MDKNILERIKVKKKEIYEWLESKENNNLLPFYLSIDIRDAEYKCSFVDTNLFPAGFNNLCKDNLKKAISIIQKAITNRVPKCKNILLIAEEHTRNAWYLQNIKTLATLIADSGYEVSIGMFINVPENSLKLQTAQEDQITVYTKNWLESNIKDRAVDLIILNNDLTNGIPNALKNTKIPIFPKKELGWYTRLKSTHFTFVKSLIKEFAEILELDPWLFYGLFSSVTNIDINKKIDREKIYEEAVMLFHKINEKYQEHKIKEKPFVFLKSNSGTYGMGIKALEKPDDILNLNRKDRNKLFKGKGSKLITNFLLQEGIASKYKINNLTSEICIYNIDNNYAGGFFRYNDNKTVRENLNAKGMGFYTFCTEPLHDEECYNQKLGKNSMISPTQLITDCEVHFYQILARIAGIAALYEENVV